jgi:hypothetical protein
LGIDLSNFVSRAATLAAIALLALVPVTAQPRVADTVQRITVRAQAIEAFESREPKRTRFGALEFRGGLVLESANRSFGGLSALRVEADGQHFLSLSDRDEWLRGRIVYRGKVPVAIADAEMAPILGPDGRPLRRRGWYDTEALAADDGTLYVGIERLDQIVRFDYARSGLRARGQPIPVPPAVKKLPYNKSIECLAVAPKDSALAGSLILVSEHGLDKDGNLQSFLIGGAGGTFSLKRTDDFDVSDCTISADRKQLLVLERRFSWVRGVAMRIRAVPIASIKPGALVDGAELIFADIGYEIDNMEGLSVHRDATGAQVLTLISDDNFSPLQRTLLLQFAIPAK